MGTLPRGSGAPGLRNSHVQTQTVWRGQALLPSVELVPGGLWDAHSHCLLTHVVQQLSNVARTACPCHSSQTTAVYGRGQGSELQVHFLPLGPLEVSRGSTPPPLVLKARRENSKVTRRSGQQRAAPRNLVVPGKLAKGNTALTPGHMVPHLPAPPQAQPACD